MGLALGGVAQISRLGKRLGVNGGCNEINCSRLSEATLEVEGTGVSSSGERLLRRTVASRSSVTESALRE